MKLDSHWFQKVRIPPRSHARAGAAPSVSPGCDHPGCTASGVHRAPKGRDHEGQYFNFCVDHVRAYNQSYDYFRGMTDEALASYQQSAATGHRPTWKIGVNGDPGKARRAAETEADYQDPFDLFAQQPGRRARARTERAERAEPKRPLKNVELQSLVAMDLEVSATAEQIRARYKELVKRLHPDANGGDRGSEGKLREIIQAYKYLRQAGLA
jgi:hypothetical protein